jgi:catecholate siderophore receptor
MSCVKAPRSLRLGAAGAAAVLASVGAARAEEEPQTVRGITVTAERNLEHPFTDPQAPYKVDQSASAKLTEPLLDTPKSVVVISDQAIEDSGADSFRDLMRTQPGVTLGTGEGGNAFGDRIFIRGFDARNDVYVDGVRDPGVGTRETFAVEQVEIFKGPNSTFGGRGTTGGAVSLVTKQARPGDFGDVEATVGTDDTRRVTVDLNRSLSDELDVRINAMVHEAGVAGRDYVFSDRWGVAAAVTWRPTERLTLSGDYFHLTTDEVPDWGVPYNVLENRPFQVDRENYYGVLSRDFRDTFADIYTVKGEYELAQGVTLRSTLRYGQSGNAYTASAPESPCFAGITCATGAPLNTVSANAKRRDAVTEYLVNQTDLTARFQTGSIGHALVVGFEIAREETANRNRAFTECAVLPCTGTSANPRLDLFNPDPTRPFGSETAVTGRTTITPETNAIYALDTLTFGPQWEAFLGVRWDDYSADIETVSFIGSPATRLSTENGFANVQAGLVYKPRENGSVYASFASGSNPPCEQLDATAIDYGGCDARTAAFDPVRNLSYEVGTKWNLLGDNLNLTAAAFRIERDDVPVPGVVPGQATTVVARQQQRVDGIELTASGNVTERLSVFGGLSVLETEVTASDVPGQAGSKFPNIPETSFNLSARYQASDRAHLGATAIYNGEKFGGTVASLNTRAPDFWRFDLFGGYRLNERVEVSFNVLNVTDEVYYDAIYRSATPFTYIAPGRAALVTLDVDF